MEPSDAEIQSALQFIKAVRADPIARVRLLALITAAGNAKRGQVP